MSIILNLLFCIRAFLGLGDPGLFHCEDCSFVSGSYALMMLLSPVMTFKRSVGFFYHSFLQFLTDRYSTAFLIVGQHSRHKRRCILMQVQLFYENSLTRSITNSNLCTEIVYGMTTILVDSRPYPFPFWGCCCHAWLTWLIIISSRSSAILEMSKPLKSSAMAHARITKSLFQHFKSFISCFTHSHTELDAHRSWTSAIPSISENRRRLVLYT